MNHDVWQIKPLWEYHLYVIVIMRWNKPFLSHHSDTHSCFIVNLICRKFKLNLTHTYFICMFTAVMVYHTGSWVVGPKHENKLIHSYSSLLPFLPSSYLHFLLWSHLPRLAVVVPLGYCCYYCGAFVANDSPCCEKSGITLAYLCIFLFWSYLFISKIFVLSTTSDIQYIEESI